ncbi:MAG TPA: GspH/FimT family pseudopilin [Casimicrobiaceae bacterium]|nr:GspH/FimT family pseudopilin [Casimicrobiaceae bacterium]
MQRSGSSPQERGFTLIELLIGLCVLAILTGFAYPSFGRFLSEQELLGEARRLSEAVMLARSEAVKRNATVIVCATSPTRSCGTLDHWHEGWVVFVDEDGNGLPDPAEPVIGRDLAAMAGVTEVGNRPVAKYFRFDHLGQARLISGALQMGTVAVCRPGLRGYHVVLANTGRTRIERATGVCP